MTTTTPLPKPSKILEQWDPEDPDQPSWTRYRYITQLPPANNPATETSCCPFGYLALQTGLPPPPPGDEWDEPTLIPILLARLDIDGPTLTEGTRINDDTPGRHHPELSGLSGVITYLRDRGL